MKQFAKRATAVFIMLALAAGLCFTLAACSNSTSDKDLITKELNTVLDAFKNPTAESLSPYVGDGSSLESLTQYGIDYVELFQHLFKHFDYKINDVKIDGDHATVAMTVENADFEKIMNDVNATLQDDPEFVNTLMDAYSSGGQEAMYKLIFQKMYDAIDASSDIVSSDAELKLTKTNGKWEVDEDSISDFVSKIYGGLDTSNL